MDRSIKLFMGAFLASAALLFAGCTHTQKNQHAESAQETQTTLGPSGFLGDYSMLKATKDARGDTVMRYVNPKLRSGDYKAVLLDPTQFYPEPQPTEQVDAATLASIRQYVDTNLRNKLGKKVTLVSQPGPGVLRIQPAITAVSGDKAKLKPYQYIPVAFVVAEAKGRKRVAALQIEVDARDSLSGERMGAAVRQGEGAELQGKKLTLRDVQPLLDRWIDTGSAFVDQFAR